MGGCSLRRLSRLWQRDAPPTLTQLRQRYDAFTAGFGTAPEGTLVEPAQLGPIKGDWIRQGTAPRVLLYFHGGFFIAGSPRSHTALVARLCQAADASAFVPAYRLAPEAAFPSAIRDGVDTYRQLVSKGIAADSIVLAGDGSGGGLALSVLLAIRNAGLAMPAGCVAMSPWADLTLSGSSLIAHRDQDEVLDWEMLFLAARYYLAKTNPGDPYASPAYASFRDFPPLMIHAGSREILRDDASRIGDRAAEAAVPVSIEIYDGMPYLFQRDVSLSEARTSLQRLGQFIRARTPAPQA